VEEKNPEKKGSKKRMMNYMANAYLKWVRLFLQDRKGMGESVRGGGTA